jgi:hypothetical protein
MTTAHNKRRRAIAVCARPHKKVLRRLSVSFNDSVVTHLLPSVTPSVKQVLFYNLDDIRRFQEQEKKRQDAEAAQHLLRMLA